MDWSVGLTAFCAALAANRASLIWALVAAAGFATFAPATTAAGLLAASYLATLMRAATLTVGILLLFVGCHKSACFRAFRSPLAYAHSSAPRHRSLRNRAALVPLFRPVLHRFGNRGADRLLTHHLFERTGSAGRRFAAHIAAIDPSEA